jgi:photosystem II stability/assembly factor-like uncharacterized protein
MVLVLVVVLLIGLGLGGRGSADPAAREARAARAASVAVSALTVEPLYLGHGVGIVATDPTTGPGCPHLFSTTDFRHWRDISPPQISAGATPCLYLWQSAAFISPTQGWVLGRNGAATDTVLYRTVDGGASWTRLPGSETGSNGGTQVIGFTSAADGWRQQFATGRSGPYLLETTSDGGASWNELPQMLGNGGCMFAPDVFANPTDGFAAGGMTSWLSEAFGSPPAQSSIWHTVDGGRSWSPLTVPAPAAPAAPAGLAGLAAADAYLGLPTFVTTASGILPTDYVTKGGHSIVAFDATADAGNSWTPISTINVGPIGGTVTDTPAGDPACSASAPSSAIPAVAVAGPATWWVMGPGRGEVEVTSDRGASWTRVRTTGLRARGTILSSFDAANARVAWASTTNESIGARSFETTDGGRTWSPLRIGRLRVSGRTGASPTT